MVVLLLATSGGRASPASSAPRAAGPLYAFAGTPARLHPLDPRTLRVRPGRSAATAGHVFGWSISPDRTLLAAGSDSTAEVRFYDLRRLRSLGDVALVPLAVSGLVTATTWASPSRVVAVVISPGCCGLGDTTVSGLDARSRRELWRRDLHGSLQSLARYRGGFALVVGPKYTIGASRLVVVSSDGRVRTARLDRIRSGWRRSGSGADVIAHEWNPGLALDRSAGRAFVVQAGAPVAEIDLRRLFVRYHEPAEPISFLGRVRDWLEPKAEAKGMQGPLRIAARLGGGRLAVTGVDHQLSHDAQGRLQETDVPAGLKLVDTRTWSVRTLDHATTTVTVAGGVLFAYGTSWDSRTSRTTGEGLTAYDAGGRELYHRYGDEPIYGVTALPQGVLVAGNQASSVFRRQDLLDPRTGRVIRQVPAFLQPIAGDQPFWF
ncbi:MAG TPA: hypothetical protein VFU56_04760 [Gaiellaceae bacterium]|nr:hypothetical protein [Gaiellaceae bacterium]